MIAHPEINCCPLLDTFENSNDHDPRSSHSSLRQESSVAALIDRDPDHRPHNSGNATDGQRLVLTRISKIVKSGIFRHANVRVN
jgi:hypothetical protein